MKLENKVAIITGSTKGIGKAAAMIFVAEGAKVVVVGTNKERGDATVKEILAAGGEGFFQQTDVTDEASLDALVNATMEHYGRIDILVNNAGVSGTTANMNDISSDEWNTVLSTKFNRSLHAL
jgi:Dehydrogenases with different specificities (related to short-chain alcohol dehydrogenases)